MTSESGNNHHEMQPSLDEGISSLEHRIERKIRPVIYEATTARFIDLYGPVSVDRIDATAGFVEVDVEDPKTPGSPILYEAALFTDRGSARHGLRAQLSRDVTMPNDSYHVESVYQVGNDGSVRQGLRHYTEVRTIMSQWRELVATDIGELASQLVSLDKPNDQRKYPTVLK